MLITIPVVIITVLAVIMLRRLVLSHSGRGDGLSDMFGGGIGAEAAGSTVVERNLGRLTLITALVFSFGVIALTIRMH